MSSQLFTDEEYLSRVKKVQNVMQEKGIDILIASDPANINYLTGHDAWSFYVHQCAIVTLDDPMPYFWGRYMDAFSGVAMLTYLDEAHVRYYADSYMHNPTCHPMEVLAEVIKELKGENKTIGVEMDNYWFSAAAYETLMRELPNAKFTDANVLVNWVRIIKSDAEFECQKKAGKIAELAMQAGIDALYAGARECDVAAAVYNASYKGTPEFGGDYSSIALLMPHGETAGAPHLTWTDEKYPNNTFVYLELAGCYRRYHSPMSRTVVIGDKNPKIDQIADVVVEGLNACLDFAKPGVTCHEIWSVFNEIMKKGGLEKESRIGYSMGLNYPPDWGEHTASIRKGDMTVLQPNMTFHLIPGMYFDDCGASISEAFYVTENGVKTFANFPRKLFYK